MARTQAAETAVLKSKIDGLSEDIDELKASVKRLEQFMYEFQGGKAWMFGLLAIAATMGGLISTFAKHLFKQ